MRLRSPASGESPRPVERCGGEIGERAGRLGARAHQQKHAAHIRMPDNRRSAVASHWHALHPCPCVFQRLLIGALGDRDALHPDIESRVVHHGEHALHAAMLLAHEEADRTLLVAEGEHGGRASMDTEFVLQADAAHVVAPARCAIRIGQELRH